MHWGMFITNSLSCVEVSALGIDIKHNKYEIIHDSNLSEILKKFWTDSWINSKIDLILNTFVG